MARTGFRRSIATLSTAALAAALALSGCSWSFDTADGTGSAAGSGRVNHDLYSNSSAVSANGSAYVFFGDSTTDRLRVGTSSDGATFTYQDIDGFGLGSSAGRDGSSRLGNSYVSAIAIDNAVHVYYNDDKYNLRHATLTPSGWVFETLDGPGSSGVRGSDSTLWTATHPFEAINNAGSPEIFYEMTDNAGGKNRLRHAWTWSGNWYFETLDGFSSTAGNGSIQTIAGGDPAATVVNGVEHVVYIDRNLNKCRHGWYTNGAWHFEALSIVCNERPEAVNFDNQLHLFTAEGDLIHLWGDGLGTPFKQEILDGAGGDGGRINQFIHGFISAYNVAGEQHVFYFDYDNKVLRHGSFDRKLGAWKLESLDGPGTETQGKGRWNKTLYAYRQIAVTLLGRTLHIWYMGETGWAALRHAAWAPRG